MLLESLNIPLNLQKRLPKWRQHFVKNGLKKTDF